MSSESARPGCLLGRLLPAMTQLLPPRLGIKRALLTCWLALALAASAADFTAKLSPLIEPAKLATLGQHEANPRIQKAVAILADAKAGGAKPAEVTRRAVERVGYTGGAADLTTAALLRNLDIAGKLGCLDAANLAAMRRGNSPNRQRLQRLRRELGHEAIWCRPRTSIPDAGHVQYPYLLPHLAVTRPDQVWCSDLTYVPMPAGHAFLCAVMDWHTRKVLGWVLSNTMDTGLCLEALKQALETTGRGSGIFNTDQGSQFTAAEWTGRLTELGVNISRDGRGRWLDNVFITPCDECLSQPIGSH
jgi:transposase InsO family protein